MFVSSIDVGDSPLIAQDLDGLAEPGNGLLFLGRPGETSRGQHDANEVPRTRWPAPVGHGGRPFGQRGIYK